MSKTDEFVIKAKVLFYGNFMVDEYLLNKGLYETKRPTLHSLDSTIEQEVEIAKMMVDKVGQSFIPESYLENLNKCEFREVIICADLHALIESLLPSAADELIADLGYKIHLANSDKILVRIVVNELRSRILDAITKTE
jgi:hypothetical protein